MKFVLTFYVGTKYGTRTIEASSAARAAMHAEDLVMKNDFLRLESNYQTVDSLHLRTSKIDVFEIEQEKE